MRRAISSTTGPEPFPGVPILEPHQTQQPGEVLIRYELENATGCKLNTLGWCCFGALCCVALPLSWLPFVCEGCRRKCQRPVYGYPVDGFSFITAADVAWSAQKQRSSAAAPPAVLCMDISLLEHPEVKLDQADQGQTPAAAAASPHVRHSMPGQVEGLRCTPSPPPMSIFVPPSAVPAHGLTPHNPFPSRYSPAQSGGSPHRSPMAYGQSCPQPASPRPGTGLPMVGMMDEQQEARELVHQQQQQAQAMQQAQVLAVQQAQVLAMQQ